MALQARMNRPPGWMIFSPAGSRYSTPSIRVPVALVFRPYTKQLVRSSQLPVSRASLTAVTAVLPLALMAHPCPLQKPQLEQAGRPP